MPEVVQVKVVKKRIKPGVTNVPRFFRAVTVEQMKQK